MLPPLPLSALTVLGLFPAVICTVLIRSWRANLCPSVSLHTFPTYAPHPTSAHVLISIMAMMDYWHLTNMTGCHRSLGRDFQTVFPLELTIIEIVY